MIAQLASAGSKNGFDLDNSLIPEEQILKGGPPKDGIPAIHNPVFIEAGQADYLYDGDRVLGVVLDGQAKAYPIRILNWHEVVNDKLADTDYSVTYCPLCGTGVAFKGSDKSSGIKFGVSGLLYNSDVLLYDLQTQSLWSQIMGRAISGERIGEQLIKIPLHHTTWQKWREQYPETLVLSTDTGFARDYDRDPYDGYGSSAAIFFPISETAPADYHPKEQVIGLEYKEKFIAFPFVELNKHNTSKVKGNLNGLSYTLIWDKTHQSARVLDDQDDPLAVIQAFWFAWFTFHPDTAVFKAEAN